MRWRIGALLVVAVGVTTLVWAQPATTSRDAGVAAWQTVYAVLENPRCRNCHPIGDAPLQFDDGRPHGQNITRRSERNGVPCATCHREHNGTRAGQPPGAPNWHLPPAATPMIFEGRSSTQLCEQLKDPTQTGGRDLAGLVHHVADDPLVGWGWDPGAGRTPAPGTQKQFGELIKAWADAGAICPTS